MNPSQRRAAFERFLTGLAKGRSRRLGLGYVGTIRRLPPPPLPGEDPVETICFLNATTGARSGPRLVELGGPANAALRRAEKWVETGEGRPPVAAGPKPKSRRLKRKV